MKKIIGTLIVLFLTLSISASANDILIKKTFWSGWQYSANGGIMYNKVGFSGDKLYQLMDGNDEAQSEMKKYQSSKVWAVVTGVPGGFLIGWPLGGYLGSSEWKDSYTTMLIVGAPLAIISMIAEGSATRHLKEAVRIYNGEDTSLSLALNYKPTYTSSNKLMLQVSLNF